MTSKVCLNEFKSNLDLAKASIADSYTRVHSRIEYRTFDEGMCDANLFVLPKSEVSSELEAFVILCNFQLHFYEEWMLADTDSDNVESILNFWMLPEVEGYLFKSLSASEVHKEKDWIINSIRKLLSDDNLSEKKARDPDRWGVYVNGERYPVDTSLSDLGVNDIVSGIGFDLEWNSIAIMYQTENDYVFFSWGTGA